jgi:hypothetical protein
VNCFELRDGKARAKVSPRDLWCVGRGGTGRGYLGNVSENEFGSVSLEGLDAETHMAGNVDLRAVRARCRGGEEEGEGGGWGGLHSSQG